MKFIVIECWPDAKGAAIVVDEATMGNKVFDSRADAEIECEKCQRGKVIEI